MSVHYVQETAVACPAIGARHASADDLARLYRERGPAFAAVASGICGDLGADAVQDAFVRALRRIGGFRARGSLEAWMWKIVVNEARRRAGAGGAVVDPAVCAAGEAVPVRDVDARVRSIVAGLPERQRAVVFLRYYADLDEAAIARALGIRRGTVAATLHHAHARVRTLLAEEEAP